VIGLSGTQHSAVAGLELLISNVRNIPTHLTYFCTLLQPLHN